MIFKSRQVNLDPEPWVDAETGERLDVGDVLTAIFEDRETIDSPRPEFEPTRDPEPYAHRAYGDRCEFPLNSFVWAPRREQFDTPVNRVLVLFRRDAEHNGIDSALEYDWPTNSVASSAEEIDHARRVLTRLANWKEQ